MTENVVRFRFRALRAFSAPKRKPRVVLLQGPVGPFFRHLQSFLEQQGYDCLRVCFNAGDRFFASREKRFDYAEGAHDWTEWCSAFLSLVQPDHLIFFGGGREYHRSARLLALAADVNVISLEEGYIRPGFITVERDANNAASSIAGRLPPADFDEAAAANTCQPHLVSNAFGRMCAHGAAYYTARTLFSSSKEREIFHRRFNPLQEVFSWTRNYYRRHAHLHRNFTTIEKLLEHHHGRYFVVPLQVPNDTQLLEPARGWNNPKLIMAALDSFARSAPMDHRLVFKIHPMERGHSNDHRHICESAKLLGIEHRVDVLDTGSLGLLTRHSAGMITINSTSGLSAIAHGVPLLVLGEALYSNDELVVCAGPTPNFDAFWHGAPVAATELRRRYLTWIKASCLKSGDFYAPEGMLPACEGILQVLRSFESAMLADITEIAANDIKPKLRSVR